MSNSWELNLGPLDFIFSLTDGRIVREGKDITTFDKSLIWGGGGRGLGHIQQIVT